MEHIVFEIVTLLSGNTDAAKMALLTACNKSLKTTIDNYQKELARTHEKITSLKKKVAHGESEICRERELMQEKFERAYDLGVQAVSFFLLLHTLSVTYLQTVDLWQGLMTPELGASLKAGLKLTYEQYEGLRFCLSHKFNAEKGVHERRTLGSTSALNITCYECSVIIPV